MRPSTSPGPSRRRVASSRSRSAAARSATGSGAPTSPGAREPPRAGSFPAHASRRARESPRPRWRNHRAPPPQRAGPPRARQRRGRVPGSWWLHGSCSRARARAWWTDAPAAERARPATRAHSRGLSRSPDAAPLAATVIADGWVQIDDAGRGDVAVLGLQADPPQGMAPPPLLRPPSVMDHRFSIKAPAGLEDAWATGVMRGATGPGRQWVQLEDVKVAQPSAASAAPPWDDELGGRHRRRRARARRGQGGRDDPDRRALPALARARAKHRLAAARRSCCATALAAEGAWRPPAARRLALAVQRTRGGDEQARDLARCDRRRCAQAFVVTGGPGSGKSSVLAWLVTLADADERAKAPAHVLEGPLPPSAVWTSRCTPAPRRSPRSSRRSPARPMCAPPRQTP